MNADETDLIKKALSIAVRDLRACYGDNGILAGRHQFSEYWSWDSFFASMGAEVLGDKEIVRKNLQMYLDAITYEGQIPYRFGSMFGIITKMSGLGDMGKVSPRYRLHPLLFLGTKKKWNTAFPKLPNIMVLIAIASHPDLVKKNSNKIEQVIAWLERQEREGLIYESWHEGWADSLRTEGWGLSTNVCYWKALNDLGKKEKAKRVKELITHRFWNGEYLRGWMGQDKKYDYFSTDGNMLAVWWNLLDKSMTKKIVEAYLELDREQVVPSSNNKKGALSNEWIPNRFRIIGIGDYHDYSVCWSWLGCVSALALNKVDQLKARDVIFRLSRAIVREGGVYEVYERNGRPLKHMIYKSEHPFGWSAGLFVRACYELCPELLGK